MKKIISFCLLAALILTAAGCGKKPEPEPEIVDREYVAEEVLAAARDLIPKTDIFDYIFWGEGIPPSEEEGRVTVGRYVEADGAWLSEKGFSSVADIREKAGEVYSSDTMAWIGNTVFSGVRSDTGYLSLARYIDYESDDDPPVRCVLVNPDATVYARDGVEYHTESAEITGVRGEVLKVRIPCTVTDAETGATQTQTLDAQLIEEENGWRVHSPTHLSYIPNAD